MQARNYITKYAANTAQKGYASFYKIKATEKWVEYQLDIHDMNNILMSLPFYDKMNMLEAINIAERKRDYMYRHPNFDFKKATRLFALVKDSPKVAG